MVIEVARLGTLTKATKALFLTQSALSHQLKNMEEELEVVLFNRTKNRMVITQEGQLVLNYAERVLEHLDQLKQEIEKLKNETSENSGIFD